MSILRRSRRFNPEQSRTLPDYEGMEGLHDWAGLWQLNYNDMRWDRPEYYYMRSALSERVERYRQLHRGPSIRPGLLREVVDINTPLAVLRSHPDASGTLPSEREGIWTDTNPAWPEMSIDTQLKLIGIHAVWADCSSDYTEEIKLAPDFIGEVDSHNSEPFDSTPRLLSGIVVYVKPGPGRP